MRTIWKYELKDPDVAVDLPFNGKVVHFGMQSKGIGDYGERFGYFIWVEFDTIDSPPSPQEDRLFSVVPTGGPIPTIDGLEARHVQTIQVKHAGPETVWHLYEATPTHSPD